MSAQKYVPPVAPTSAILIDQRSEEFQKLLSRYWHYSIEYAPGQFTNAELYSNVIVMRDLLQRVAVKGGECIELGAKEGMMSMLLSRRDTKHVLALDQADFSDKVAVVRALYGVKFAYHPRVALHDTLRFLRDRQQLMAFQQPTMPPRGFDVAVMSGLLNQVFSPLHVIGLARSLLRPGGVLVLETAASVQDAYAMQWNFNGASWTYPNGANTWFITLRLLDHFLRFLRLKPVDVSYVPGGGNIVRVGVSAIAMDEPLDLANEGDCFVQSTQNMGYHQLVDLEFAQPRQPGRPPITVTAQPNLIRHPGTDLVDIHRSVMERPALTVDPDRIRFRLIDRI